MDLMMGSPNSFILTARLINETMRENDLIHIEKIKAKEPLNVLAWKTRSGELTILTGNLEEGINHSPSQNYNINLVIPGLQENGINEIFSEWDHFSNVIKG